MEYTPEERGERIIQACMAETSCDPAQIFEHLARQDFIRMHGPEHHMLDGACLLTAYHNAGGSIDLEAALHKIITEGQRMPGAVCGLWGVCGAVMSIGAALGSVPVMLIASFAYAKRLDENGNVVLGENGRAITDMQYAPVIRGVIAMALCSLVLLLIAFALNQERVKTKPRAPEKGAAVKAMKLLFQNRAFVAVSMASMLLLAGQMFTQSFYTYLFDDYFHANWMNLASQACTYSPMLVLMFCLPNLARKLGKKEICAVGTLAAALANLALFFLRGMDPGVLMWVFLVLCFVSGCGLTTLVMQLWAMVTDAIDDLEVSTGSRDDGTAYSVFNFFRKLGQVLSAVCVNGALLRMNYRYEKGAVQTLANLKSMYDLATLIPAVLFGLMSLILFVWYPLNRQRVARLQQDKERKLREALEAREIEI